MEPKIDSIIRQKHIDSRKGTDAAFIGDSIL